MKPDYLITFMTVAALVWALGAALAFVQFRHQRRSSLLLYLCISLIVLVATLTVDATVSAGRNAVVHLLTELSNGSIRHLGMAGLGACFGFGAAVWPWQSSWRSPWTRLGVSALSLLNLLSVLGGFVFASTLALHDYLKPYLVHRSLSSIAADPFGIYVAPGFHCEEFHRCDSHPVQIALGPAGDLYATAYAGVAYQYGIVTRLAVEQQTGNVVETTVARHLNRPHGLAFHEDVLFVSRSGQYSQADGGVLRFVNAGAVTMLRDTDCDGIMDYYEDVVTDLPGAQGPDELHQNNGIAFSPDGYMYITSGTNSNRAPASHPFEGTILRCRPDGSDLNVYARGFRNPFDLTIGPANELFATDNDDNNRRSGDELNHVTEGNHYGFPYADGRTGHPQGTVPPLEVAHPGTFQGLAYAAAACLPDEYRGCLYVVSYGNGEIWRIRVSGKPGAYRTEKELFARIPHALDITVGSDGTFYVSSFETGWIYRIKLREAQS